MPDSNFQLLKLLSSSERHGPDADLSGREPAASLPPLLSEKEGQRANMHREGHVHHQGGGSQDSGKRGLTQDRSREMERWGAKDQVSRPGIGPGTSRDKVSITILRSTN